MENIDNATIIKWVAIIAVTYVLYNSFVKKDGFHQRLQYSNIAPSASTSTYASNLQPDAGYLPPMSVATDLLPKTQLTDDGFSEFAPNNLQGMNFLDPSAIIGVDTQGSSRRNPNLQLRADPPCPRNQGTLPAPMSCIQPDAWRKPLDDCY